jgi:outer membrane immunogenic protein
MKKMLLALSAAAAFTGSAYAADLPARMPMKAPPPPPVAAVNWTGCYIAGGGGGAISTNDNNLFTVPNAPPFPTLNKTDGARGWFGTVQGGCDYQFAGNWVVGAFADADFSDIRGDHLGLALAEIGRQKQDWSWAVGGRLGYLVVPQLLTYVSAGYTQAHWNGVSYSFAGTPGTPPAFTTAGNTRGGWFVGTGDEYALRFLPGLFWKTEYRYSEFDASDTRFFTVPPVVATGEFIHEKFREHSVRSELVYRFNWSGPLVARY